MEDYLHSCKQKDKVKIVYSTWQDVVAGIAHSSILTPILLNIFLWNLFLDQGSSYFIYCTIDTTPFVVRDNTTGVLSSLTRVTQELFTCFANNQMETNHDKCYLLLSIHEQANIQIANMTIESSASKNLLGVTTDNKLKFDEHIENICQKASRKLNVPGKLLNYMNLPKRHLLMNAFFNAQFNYCPAIWKLYS